jgi:hypothetical protein
VNLFVRGIRRPHGVIGYARGGGRSARELQPSAKVAEKELVIMLEAIWISIGTNSLTTERAEKHGNNQEWASPRFLAARHQPTQRHRPRSSDKNACGTEIPPSRILMARGGIGALDLHQERVDLGPEGAAGFLLVRG